jgi:hypothetical protein
VDLAVRMRVGDDAPGHFRFCVQERGSGAVIRAAIATGLQVVLSALVLATLVLQRWVAEVDDADRNRRR